MPHIPSAPTGSGTTSAVNLAALSLVTIDSESGLTAEYVLGTAVIMSGLTAARPASAKAGLLYYATDDDGGTLFRDNASSWVQVTRGQTEEYLDTVLIIQDNAASTKKFRFEASGVTAGQTRVLTVPDFNGTIATLAGTETFTNKTLTSPTINGGTHTAITGLGIRDTSAAFDVTIAAVSSTPLAAGRTLTLDMVNAARTVKLQGNLDIGGTLTTANTFTTSGNNALTLTTTGSTNVTLPTTGTLATLAGAETLTNKVLTAPDINAGTADSLTSLSVRDTSAAFDLTIAAVSSSALTAGRTLTIDVINAARTIKLAGNVDLAGSFTTSGANAITLTTTGATGVTLPTTGTLATLAGSETFTNKTLTTPTIGDFSNATHTHLAAASGGLITVPIIVYKSADETVNNSTTFQNDDALVTASLTANKDFLFEAGIRVDSSTVADLKIQFTLPASATMEAAVIYVDTAGTNAFSAIYRGASLSTGGAGAGTTRYISIHGLIKIAGTAGTVQLQWAQDSLEASDTKVLAGSFFRYHQLN